MINSITELKLLWKTKLERVNNIPKTTTEAITRVMGVMPMFIQMQNLFKKYYVQFLFLQVPTQEMMFSSLRSTKTYLRNSMSEVGNYNSYVPCA